MRGVAEVMGWARVSGGEGRLHGILPDVAEVAHREAFGQAAAGTGKIVEAFGQRQAGGLALGGGAGRFEAHPREGLHPGKGLFQVGDGQLLPVAFQLAQVVGDHAQLEGQRVGGGVVQRQQVEGRQQLGPGAIATLNSVPGLSDSCCISATPPNSQSRIVLIPIPARRAAKAWPSSWSNMDAKKPAALTTAQI